MLPLLIGAGLIAYALFAEDEKPTKRSKKIKKKIFTSFAIEDKKYSSFLHAQSRNDRSPFTFSDMSLKQALPENIWKDTCRKKIRECDGMIVLLSKHTYHSSGSRWEIKCAKEEGIPIIGMHINKDYKGAIPPELKGKKIIDWTWDKLDHHIKRF